MPLAVILVALLGMLGVVVALWLRGIDNSIYAPIGIVLIVALASKSAILIVEFARHLQGQGRRPRAMPRDPSAATTAGIDAPATAP